ncbi:MAG: DUF6115 domain-containing protein [Lachnospiraceae bacterium]
MGIIEIVILIGGILLVIISFLLPEKIHKNSEVITEAERTYVKKVIEEEISIEKIDLEEKIEEFITAHIEKNERLMERLSNEKIMAINEYSDTVLEQIHKNQEEVLFLYDMLNNKQTQIKNTISDISNKVKDASIAEELIENKNIVSNEIQMSSKKESENNTTVIKEEPKEEKVTKKRKRNNAKVELNFDTTEEGNNNDMILSLHNEGKSNMAIAKELGLGVGEVKLVIDLFQEL